jgi:hypothetical protein
MSDPLTQRAHTMKIVLTAILGVWFLAAPAICGAVCWAPPAADEVRKAAADAPMASCHSEENAPSSSEPVPSDGDDCCDGHDASEIGPLPGELASIHAPELALALLIEPAPSQSRLGLPAHSRDGPDDGLHSPYRSANPPLLN